MQLFRYLAYSLVVVAIGLTVVTKPIAAKSWKYCNAAGYPTTFDRMIRKAVIKHWPLEWQMFHCDYRAQLARESSLSDRACQQPNHAGAQCIAQLLPETAADIERATGLTHTRTNAVAAVYAGAWYMGKTSKTWLEYRAAECRLKLTQAGYISGNGHIIQAQRLARKDGKTARCFPEIAPYLDQVITPKNAQDVINYVNSINALADRMR